MEKHLVNLSSGYDGIAVSSFKMVGPTLALAMMEGQLYLINWVLLGLTLAVHKDTTDEEVFEAYVKQTTVPSRLHVSPQGVARITGEPLSDGVSEDDCAIVAEKDLAINSTKDGFRAMVYPDGLSNDEIDNLAEDEDVDHGTPIIRFFAFSWIEAIEPCPQIAKNDAYTDEEEEAEVEVEA
jgi:hypothetical protein